MPERGRGVMKVDLRPLRAERGARLEVACHELVASRVDEIPFTEPVEGTLTLTNLGSVLRVAGRLETRVGLVCGLCATSFQYRLEAAVDEKLEWASAGAAPPPGGDAYLVQAGDTVLLDAESLARDALVLALPMVARCSPDCQGLCVRCGANLRLEPCRCPPQDRIAESIDPRLRTLTAWQAGRSSSGSALS
jgi:uncharacterized protein